MCYKIITVYFKFTENLRFSDLFFISYFNPKKFNKGCDIITNYFNKLLTIIILFSIFISIFFIPIIQGQTSNYQDLQNKEIISLNPDGFVWPIPGYMQISSPFGKRKAPTGGASSFHYGTDIPAPEGNPDRGTQILISTIDYNEFTGRIGVGKVADGEITFTQFLGAGGYTITLSFDNYKVSYCHVSPNFIVSVGDHVSQGQVIGYVGPKYVYGVPGNPYCDATGKPTNGATTRLSFASSVLELIMNTKIL